MVGKSINSVSSFLQSIQKKVLYLRRLSGSDLFVFRGESKLFRTPGMPNLFREPNKTAFENVPYFEKNILNIFHSNGFSESLSYLELAIDAQHGGFASRLLDVSFNSLVALFFAVQKPMSEEHPEDAAVFIYAVNDLYSPESHSVQELYDSILNQESASNNRLSGYNHIFIDYVKSNKRIIAQHGGFILFPGTEYVPFPPFKTERIIIDGSSRTRILDELSSYFGITEGSIYPESNTNVRYLTKKAVHMRNASISGRREQEAFIEEFADYCEYYTEQAAHIMTDLCSKRDALGSMGTKNEILRRTKFEELLLSIENELLTARTTWNEYRDNLEKLENSGDQQYRQKKCVFDQNSEKFDTIMRDFEQRIKTICNNYKMNNQSRKISPSIFTIESFEGVQR